MKSGTAESLIWTALLGLAWLLLMPRVGWAESSFDGSWEGPILVKPGTYEVDLRLDVEEAENGIRGYVSFPTRYVLRHPATDFRVDGDTVRFSYRDGRGDAWFCGRLSADGQEIVGEFERPGEGWPARLVRRIPGPDPIPEVHLLSDDGRELIDLFRASHGSPRLLLILSPGWNRSRIGARLVLRYVLQQIEDPAIRVFVVWEPRLPEDSLQYARDVAVLLPEPRVTQFWSQSRWAGRTFEAEAGYGLGPASNVYLLFPRVAEWKGEAPAASLVMHNQDDLPLLSKLQAEALADMVRSEVASPVGVRKPLH